MIDQMNASILETGMSDYFSTCVYFISYLTTIYDGLYTLKPSW